MECFTWKENKLPYLTMALTTLPWPYFPRNFSQFFMLTVSVQRMFVKIGSRFSRFKRQVEKKRSKVLVFSVVQLISVGDGYIHLPPHQLNVTDVSTLLQFVFTIYHVLNYFSSIMRKKESTLWPDLFEGYWNSWRLCCSRTPLHLCQLSFLLVGTFLHTSCRITLVVCGGG